MAFTKLVKTNAYFKRYQTKFRRRREGKTDYFARKKLITQDNNKYNTKKYRFVSRITSGKVICQVIYATLTGDRVLCAADSSELKRFGLEAGLTNYSTAYCTGLLLARRLLKQTGMDKLYKGVEKCTGELYKVDENPNEERTPFKAILDVGITRTTTGNRVFSCLKGACDGGIHIPHSEKRFAGYIVDGDEEKYDAAINRDRIFGVHVDKYMAHLKEDNEDFKKQFSKWSKCLEKNGVKTCEDLYKKIHSEIRKNPDRLKRKVLEKPKRDHSKKRQKKLSKKEKKKRTEKKIEIAMKKAKKGKK